MKPSKGVVGVGERGSLFISNMFDGGGGGGLIERWACLIWGFRYCFFKDGVVSGMVLNQFSMNN